MAHYVLTGASGFVGQRLAKHLLEAGHRVTGVSRSEPAINHSSYSHKSSDLASWASWADELGKCDVFVHLAWGGSMGPERADLQVQQNNVKLALDAVRLAKRLDAQRFVGVGTITEAEVDAVALIPGVDHGPGLIYGAAKRMAATLAGHEASKLGMEFCWARLGNTYGLNDPTVRMLSGTVNKLVNARDGEVLEFSEASQDYDFVAIEDAVRALELIGERGLSGSTYYVGSGQAQPLRGFIEELASLAQSNAVLNFGAIAAAGVAIPLEAFSIESLRSDTGYEVALPFSEGAARLISEARASEKS